MKNGFIKKLSDSKNVKYSTVNYTFCALVLAIVIVLNAMFTVLAGKFQWYLDMTDEGIFTMSDKFEAAVEEALEAADYICTRPGGSGSVREVVQMVMKVQGTWELDVQDYKRKF